MRNEKKFTKDESPTKKVQVTRVAALARAGRDSFSGDGALSRRQLRGLSLMELLKLSCSPERS